MTPNQSHVAGLELALSKVDPWSDRAVWLRDLIDQAKSAPAEPVSREAVGVDQKLEAAGMFSVAKLLQGAPLDAFVKHAGVNDAASLLQWAEMKRGEYLRMQARYDLGEKEKGDDLYEWVIAHCAVFTELHVNIRAALTAPPSPDAELVELLRECAGSFALWDSSPAIRLKERIDAKLASLKP